MQSATSEYARAITAGYRRILPRAIMDIVDPDIVYEAASASGQGRFSRPGQLHDKVFEAAKKYGTLEQDRFRLDGSFALYPDSPEELTEEHGFLGDALSREDGTFDSPPYVQLNVKNLGVMQACSVHFTGRDCDGLGEDFRLEVYSGNQTAYAKQVRGNRDRHVYFEGFTARDVTAIRVSFTRWSAPHRYVRLLEIVPGIYENWDADTLYSIDVLQETAPDCMSTPFGTCNLQVHNKNLRFNPYNRAGLFASIEERQGVEVAFGVETPGGTEFLPLGVYYQKSGGWETDAYGLTIAFKLVDIVGLLAERDFIPPDPLPVTLEGWLAALAAQLGENFKTRYTVEGALAGRALTADAAALKNMTCGTVLRYLSMRAAPSSARTRRRESSRCQGRGTRGRSSTRTT